MRRDGYAIRLGREADLASLAGVERSASVTYFEALGSPSDLPEVLPPDVIEASHAAGLLWVAADRQDAPVGFLAAQAIDGSLFVKEISVAREHQRVGLGRQLLQVAEDHAREASYGALALITDRFIPFNGPFYEKLGFREVSVERASPGFTTLFAQEIAGGFDPRRRILMMKPLAALQVSTTPLYAKRI
jgi:GNAT superfamily N-acetyltransferase